MEGASGGGVSVSVSVWLRLRARVGVTWRIVAVWSSLSSDVRKCVNLESESGGCATAPVCPTAGECEKSITCAEVEK
jgi:hypothetical protein